MDVIVGSNNTNKLSPQERYLFKSSIVLVQIIQINLVLKNAVLGKVGNTNVQIIQINLVLKNQSNCDREYLSVQIIQINLVLKNLRL